MNEYELDIQVTIRQVGGYELRKEFGKTISSKFLKLSRREMERAFQELLAAAIDDGLIRD